MSPYQRNEKFVETFHHVNQLQHIISKAINNWLP
jgi:hypothetical protein